LFFPNPDRILGFMLDTPVSSGHPGLDSMLGGLWIGDNVVWRISSIDAYSEVCEAMVAEGLRNSLPVVYFRFANHRPVIRNTPGVRVHKTHPEKGFEHFITEIHRVITEVGLGGVYILDSLSDLQNIYYSDRMIGCFFQLTCPFLRAMETIAYFAISWSGHSSRALEPILKTTQVWIDVFGSTQETRVQHARPLKVSGRLHGPAELFEYSAGTVRPVENSVEASRIIARQEWYGHAGAEYRRVDSWHRFWLRLEDLTNRVLRDPSIAEEHDRLVAVARRMMLTSDARIFAMTEQYISPSAMITIWRRMIGTGMIGGKAVGMLLARSIVRKDAPEIPLEDHDSFYIGSDVFYTFLVENACWWERQRQKDPDKFLEGIDQARDKIINGRFPEYVLDELRDMLTYFGTAPIIVRSSSLLEDAYRNAFAGKYDSVFCAGKGTLEERLQEVLNAIRQIYAGTMSREALEYRRQRGVLERDEQMALLIQRVSGTRRNKWFYPDVAGVMFSYNPFVWHPTIEPSHGMARMVAGLGTRAVERVAEDHPRLVALGEPTRDPGAGPSGGNAQRWLDVIDLEQGLFTSVSLEDVLQHHGVPSLLVRRDWRAEREARRTGAPLWAGSRLSLNAAISAGLAAQLRRILEVVREVYRVEVDMEWTAHIENDAPVIDIVQCRPFHIRSDGPPVPEPALEPGTVPLMQNARAVLGYARNEQAGAVVWVDPERYTGLYEQDRYLVGNEIRDTWDRIPKTGEPPEERAVLVGPGRWGTSTPAMGVPVRFSQLRGASTIVEYCAMHHGLTPDISLGTHFFLDLVETQMMYVALSENPDDVQWERLKRESIPYGKTGAVYIWTPPPGYTLWMYADPVSRRFLVYEKSHR
jgi:pyruvate, water dikinase